MKTVTEISKVDCNYLHFFSRRIAFRMGKMMRTSKILAALRYVRALEKVN